MNEQDIYEGIGQVDDEILLRSEQKKHRRRWWISGLAAVFVVAVAVGALLPGRQSVVPTAYALAVADYPEMAQYPDESAGNFETAYRAWREDQEKQRRDSAYADGLAPFLTSSMEVFLSGAGEENRVYSPLNVYMALAMLAEVTGGESRAQVLNLLGSDSLESLRSQASDLWNDHYCDDGATTSILASSLWLDEGISYNQDTLHTLADTYYASTFQGQMGDGAYTRALRDWLNEQTGGLLHLGCKVPVQLGPGPLRAVHVPGKAHDQLLHPVLGYQFADLLGHLVRLPAVNHRGESRQHPQGIGNGHPGPGISVVHRHHSHRFVLLIVW